MQMIKELELRCKHEVMELPYPNDGRLYCPAVFDGWRCWNYTLAGTKAYLHCPGFIDGFDTKLLAHKVCQEDGVWYKHPRTNITWSNYTTCINEQDLENQTRLVMIFISGYTVSITALLLSLVIFFYFRQLHCDRVTLHKHLFVSYILNGVAWILYYTLAALDGDVLMNNPYWCQALHVITQYFVTCNFFWMFCEGLYLHTIIVVAFTSGKKLPMICCAVGWGFPVLTTTIYTITRALKPAETKQCWLDESYLSWIVFGPIVITIILNFAFLCNIVRVLVTKLRSCNSPDANQTRKAVRATLILIPLLGLQYILLPFRPSDDSEALLQMYLYVSAMVASYQGFLVALIFCFLNGEVISIIKRKWGQHRLMQSRTKRGRSAIYTHTSMSVVDGGVTKAPGVHATQTKCHNSVPPANNRRDNRRWRLFGIRSWFGGRGRDPAVPTIAGCTFNEHNKGGDSCQGDLDQVQLDNHIAAVSAIPACIKDDGAGASMADSHAHVTSRQPVAVIAIEEKEDIVVEKQ